MLERKRKEGEVRKAREDERIRVRWEAGRGRDMSAVGPGPRSQDKTEFMRSCFELLSP